jgi:hypothetical protein
MNQLFACVVWQTDTIAEFVVYSPQMLENTWREIEYRLDDLRATNGAQVDIH